MLGSCKFKLSKDVLKRYEPNIHGGVFVLYNAAKKDFWFGNYSSSLIVNSLDGLISVEQIIKIIKKENPDLPLQELRDSVFSMFCELFEKGFVQKVE